jgi:hypothetical protein
MSALAAAAIEGELLSASAAVDGRLMTVVLGGQADTRTKTALEHFLGVVASEAMRIGVTDVDTDLRQVEFMNSTCIKGFVNWISQVQELPPEQRYRIKFISNPAAQWQRRALKTLAIFGGDLIAIV